MANMDYYNRLRSVPPEAKKPFSNGRFSGTDINPMWRIKALTEIFGPAGIGWYYEVISERCEDHGDVTIAVVDINLYVKDAGEWSKPIYGTGGNVIRRKSGDVSDEGYKMALTDALSVACKALGVGADVYYEKDTTKYTAYETPEKAPPRRETRKTAETPPEKQTAPAVPLKPPKDAFVCAECGQPIKNYGKTPVSEIVAGTMATYGKALCWDCAKKAKQERSKKEESVNA